MPRNIFLIPCAWLVMGVGPGARAIHLPFLRAADRGENCARWGLRLQRARGGRSRKFEFLDDNVDGCRALGRTDIDAVYIFGSAQLHYDYGMRALRPANSVR